MTREGYQKMQAKLEELKKRRAGISKTIGEAREGGDLRENSAYHEAKKEQGLNEMRIKELEAKLETARIVEKDTLPKSEIALGSKVRIKALDSGDEFEYEIVSESDADVFENKISTDSPIGAALYGEKKGAVVEVELPRGKVKYKVLEIR